MREASFEKAEALGERLAAEAVAALEGDETLEVSEGLLQARARTVYVPLHNKMYRLASQLGVIRRGSTPDPNVPRRIRTEVGMLEVGPVPFLLVPGEIYPEIVVGGIEAPPGQDFSLPPQEVPPLEKAFGGRIRFLIGLANDEIGYLIPKSQWDQDAPYTYGARCSPYGEISSIGPDAAGVIHRELLRLIRESGRQWGTIESDRPGTAK